MNPLQETPTTTPDREDPGVVVCPECELDFDAFDRAGEPGYFAAEHNRLHHGGNPVAFVTNVDEPARPAGPAGSGGVAGWPEGFFHDRIVGGMPRSGKTAYTLRLTRVGRELDDPLAELDPTGGETA